MSTKTKLKLIAVAMGFAAVALISWFSSPWVGLGVFVAMWANNIDRSNRD